MCATSAARLSADGQVIQSPNNATTRHPPPGAWLAHFQRRRHQLLRAPFRLSQNAECETARKKGAKKRP
jgi:hypothetical protein